MSSSTIGRDQQVLEATSRWDGLCVGQIIEIDLRGRAIVDFEGNPKAPCLARTIVTLSDMTDAAARPVLLAFENGNPESPIIVGVLQDAIRSRRKPAVKEAVVDGEKVLLEAKHEIELRCGESSIVLRKDGKILIKGANLTSRASEANKIRGASVAIN